MVYGCVRHHNCTAHLFLRFLNQLSTTFVVNISCPARAALVVASGRVSLENIASRELACSFENTVRNLAVKINYISTLTANYMNKVPLYKNDAMFRILYCHPTHPHYTWTGYAVAFSQLWHSQSLICNMSIRRTYLDARIHTTLIGVWLFVYILFKGGMEG